MALCAATHVPASCSSPCPSPARRWSPACPTLSVARCGGGPPTRWSVEGGAEVADRLPDGGLGGVGVAQGVEHHEVVDDALIAGGRDGYAGGAELVGIGLALVAQDVEACISRNARSASAPVGGAVHSRQPCSKRLAVIGVLDE